MDKQREYHKHIFHNFKFFCCEVLYLIKSPVFILLTFFGNLLIGLFCTVFYYVEKSHNPKIMSFMDALWWGFATATTTGYGDITPTTNLGKFLSILLMLTGLALFAMFTALFAETILTSSRQSKNS